MKHLVLHAGAHKTGTTLVQKALQANREAFGKKGYEVLVRNEYEIATGRVHSLWRRQGLAISNVNRGFAILRGQLEHENLVLSHEDLLASVHSFRKGPIYGTAGDVLRIAHEELRPERTTLLFYVRRQDRFVESSYLQTVRMGSTLTFEEFMEPVIDENLRWDVLIDQMRDALPEGTEIKVKYFETIKTLKSRHFVRNFFQETGVGVVPKFPFNTEGVNRGYSDVALKLALVGNAELEKEDSRTLRHFLDANFSNVTHPAPRLLTPEQREHMLTALAPSNKALHDMMGADGSSPYVPDAL
ncbi:hypothetical protein ACFS27_06775 [Promicromonospora vindobonensis]|uniref:Sulfotransferase family protein n=1 Tax=Promicromonospora vindobonensis TaxID=195748 RepID=A0ABW5VNH4_9MICO